MISRIIEFSVRNRWLVIFFWAAIAVWGMYAVVHTPVDAIPDLSENQVIVFADWMGRSPQDVEEQITYPLSVQLQGLAGVKAVRSSSEFNFSMINVIFEDSVDPYFARQRVLERLEIAKASLPADVTPELAPDATALGQIFWYTVEGDGKSLDELRAIQDFNVRNALRGLQGVAEVASVGGFVREYQIDVDPAKLRLYNLPLSAVYNAIASSNQSVGGKVIVSNNSESVLRGVGWLRGGDEGLHDLENTAVISRASVPILVKHVASVHLGPAFRRSALEKDGHEAVGGVVMMRIGNNPLAVTESIKEKIREIQSGLPAGVRIVPFYDRTRLIESAIHTVTGTLREEMIIASLAILLILAHFRSAIVVCVTLPMAVLVSFLLMYYLNIPSNIMSLSGIAISIGILVDASVVMVENATHELSQRFGDKPVTGDISEAVIHACRLVGSPIFFSVLIMLVSFLPVFVFGGQVGKLAHPLAFTKSFAMVGVALLAITLVPALIPLLIRGKLSSEEKNPIVRSFIHIYKPMLSWAMDRPGFVWWMMGAILLVGTGFVGIGWLTRVILAAGLVAVILGVKRAGWRIVAIVALVIIAFVSETRFGQLGGEFMPELDEGSIMDMPLTAPRVAMGEAVDDVMVRDRVLRSFPEAQIVVGKIGRAETATDPSPVDMVETIVTLRPKDAWPKRKLLPQDAYAQAAVVADTMQQCGWLAGKIMTLADWQAVARAVNDSEFAKLHPELNASSGIMKVAMEIVSEKFDRSMRELARRRQMEAEPDLAKALVESAVDMLMDHAQSAVLRLIAPEDRQAVLAVALTQGALLTDGLRQEQVDQLLATLRDTLVKRRVLADRDDLLIDHPSVGASALQSVQRAMGVEPDTFSQRVFGELSKRSDAFWVERTKSLNWELFDQGTRLLNDLLIDALYRTALGTPYAGREPSLDERAKLSADLTPALARTLFLWQKSRGDLVREMDGDLQMPGWGNIWTQPIINRINMLATGVRTQVGVKIFAPTGRPLEGDHGSIAEMHRVGERIVEKLKTIPGTADPQVEQSVGKRYLEIHIDREKAARYGVAMTDISEAIETALGGAKVTSTVEGVLRFPVRLRYQQSDWQDLESVKNVLVAANTTPVELTGQPASASDTGASETVALIPLRLVADLRITEGPAMIKSENGRLVSYVTLNVRDRDMIGYVDEAREAIKPIERDLAGSGMTIEWTGEFENQMRARQTMVLVFPLVFVLIVLLLYLTFHSLREVMLVILAVFGAVAGAVMFQALFGFNFSVIVAIGYVAVVGMATQTGVIMLVYLREAIAKQGGLMKIETIEQLRTAVIDGAVHRLRPKLLTEGVAIIGLVPMLWATGTGAEIMRPMAAPVLGGLLISDEVVDLMIPVMFYWLQRWQWKKSRA